MTIIPLTIGLSITGKKPVSANRFRKINGFNIPTGKSSKDVVQRVIFSNYTSVLQVFFSAFIMSDGQQEGYKIPLPLSLNSLQTDPAQVYITLVNNNNNNDRLTAFDPGQPG